MLIHNCSSARTWVMGSTDIVVATSIAIPSQRSHPSILNSRQFTSAPPAASCDGNRSGSSETFDCTADDIDRSFARPGAVAKRAVLRMKVRRLIIMCLLHPSTSYHRGSSKTSQHRLFRGRSTSATAPWSNGYASFLTESARHAARGDSSKAADSPQRFQAAVSISDAACASPTLTAIAYACSNARNVGRFAMLTVASSRALRASLPLPA